MPKSPNLVGQQSRTENRKLRLYRLPGSNPGFGVELLRTFK